MISEKFLLGRGRECFSNAEENIIEDGITDVRAVGARRVLSRRNQRIETCSLLIDGFVSRTVDDLEGRRQIVGMYVPGDFIDLDSFQLKRVNHDIVTIGPVKLAVYNHSMLSNLIRRVPSLTEILWRSTLLDAALHREWIFRLGRLGADARVAHLFCEMHARLEMVGLVQDGRFKLPMTQPDIGEVTALTSVHVNRVLRKLREGRLLTVVDKHWEILDHNNLERLANFDPLFLYGSGSKKRDADSSGQSSKLSTY